MRLSPFLVLVAAATLSASCKNDSGPTDPPNAAPAAVFTAQCDHLECTFDNGSSDDGTIQTYAWDFGDGGTSAERAPIHSYAPPGGQFTVTLTVTDDDGEQATTARDVSVSQVNNAPVAAFVASCVNLTCSFTDQSTDPDAGGTVVSHAWDFGDGRTSTEPNPTHTYTYPGGQFTVSLRVGDDLGGEATAAKQLDVAMGSGPDRSGTYRRETPHSSSGRHSRYVLNPDHTFELYHGTGADTTLFTGRWTSACCWGGWPIEPGSVLLLDFDAFESDLFCGEAFGYFLLDDQMGIAYCRAPIEAGLEEGVYTSAAGSGAPGGPPSVAGQIAFVRSGRIYLANTDGSGLRQLSAGPDDRDPAWSPDGSRIAFTRTSGGTSAVFIMDAEGGNVVQRTTSGEAPTWSPDGEWIAFTCLTPTFNVCTVKADDDGTEPVNITRQSGYMAEPAWSPDGARIAFISDYAMYDHWFDIWVMDPDGTQPMALRTHTPAAPNPDAQRRPAWSPDGRRIAYLECPWTWDICSSSVVEVMNADGSGSVRLTAASGLAAPSWSPDGQVIAFTSANAIEWISADASRRGRIIDEGHSPAWRP